MSNSTMSHIPFSPLEKIASKHAILMGMNWLIILPTGTLLARYMRTFTPKWFKVHMGIQLFIATPIFYSAWSRGYLAAGGPPFDNFPHKRVGLFICCIYAFQITLGLFIHYYKSPISWPGGRKPQNYLHAILGLTLFAMAAYQMNTGMYVVWPAATKNVHPIPVGIHRAWVAFVVIFWSLYIIGLGLLPRQWKLEKAYRRSLMKEPKEAADVEG